MRALRSIFPAVAWHLVLVPVLLLAAVSPAAAVDDVDTLTIGKIKFRLDGVDAPELDQGCLDAKGELYFCGQAAFQKLLEFVAERPIHCDDLGPDTSYNDTNRRIGWCAVDAVNLHTWLVKEGWALNFERYARGRFKQEEADASEARRGLWAGCFAAPWDFRKTNKKAVLLGAACPPDARGKLFPDDPRMPPGCPIKAKYARRALLTGHRGIYHPPGCRSYRTTKNPDRWFCSEEDARAAGFRAPLNCWFR
jgi:endonuclease YncB( thermonuclease family)